MATLETTARAPADRERLLALGAALVTVTLWASAFVGIRDAGQHFSPGALALGRLSIASLALGLIVLWRREPLPSRRDLGVIAFVGVFWFGLYNIALNEAERRVDAGTAAMLVNVGPILIAVLAGLILREGFPPRLIAGMAIAFAGVIVIGSATSDGSLAPSWGAVLCLAAAIGYAVGVVAQKPLLTRVSTLQVTWLACTFGARRLPAVRGHPRQRAAGRVSVGDRLDGLPRDRADGHRLPDLGLRALAHDGRPDGLDDLPGAADRDPARLGATRRDASRARRRRRRALSCRRDRRPAALAAAAEDELDPVAARTQQACARVLRQDLSYAPRTDAGASHAGERAVRQADPCLRLGQPHADHAWDAALDRAAAAEAVAVGAEAVAEGSAAGGGGPLLASATRFS